MKSRSLLVLALSAAASACGSEPPPGGPSVAVTREAIQGGYVDDKTTGVVGLAISNSNHSFAGHCSGTLLAPNLVLTARHCVALTAGTPNEQVQCGVSRFSTTGSGGEFLASPDTVRPTVPTSPTFFRSVEVRVPPGATDFCGHDVALLILAGAGIPGSLATPIEPRLDGPPTSGEKFSAEGFGLLSSDQTVDTSGTRMRLDGVTVRCIGAQCATVTDLVRDNEWVSVDAAICPGDSGGPALDAEGRVMGVASRASSCSNGVYGDVASWRDFIVQGAQDAAGRGGYEVPAWAAPEPSPEAGAAAGPLGQSCTGVCADGYACYTETGAPPGICVPHCGPSLDACPAGYSCSDSFGACTPSAPSSGCAVGVRPRPFRELSTVTLAVIALGLAGLRRRRIGSRRRQR